METPTEQRLEKSRKMWLLNDNDYQLFKKYRENMIPAEISLSKNYEKLTQDRVTDRLQDENLWNKLGDRIRPLIQATQSPISAPIPTAGVSQPFVPPATPPHPQHRGSLSPIVSTPTTAHFPRLAPWDDSFSGQEQSLLGAEGGDEGQSDSEAKRIILEEVRGVQAKYRNFVELLYDVLIERPEIRITSDHIYVNNQACLGRSSAVLTNLVKPNKTLSHKNPALMQVLSKIDGIFEIVSNEKAVKQIESFLSPRKSRLGSTSKTPTTTVKAPRTYKVTPRAAARVRESINDLNQWAANRGFSIDDQFELPPDLLNEFAKGKKGSGKRKKIFWRSLF